MSEPAIRTDRLTKSFGRSRGIEEISLRVEQGEVFGFLGPNGAGKTTTIRCLLGLYRPSSGGSRVLGQDPTGGTAFLADVGYLPGELQLPEALTGADLLDRFSRMRRLAEPAYRDDLVERFGAETTRPVRTLSKGNKQKLGIVLAFMHRPRLLILDEPTSGLDPLLQDEFATLLTETTADGRTVLLSSHDLDEVQRIAHRVAIVKSGRIVVDDTVEGLRGTAPGTIEASFDHRVDPTSLAALPGVTVLAASRGRRLTLTYTGSVAPALAALAELAPEAITARPADLDELFLDLYGRRHDAD